MAGAGAAVAAVAVDRAAHAGDALLDTRAKRLVVACVAGTGIITVIAVRRRQGDLPGPRLVAGLAVASAGLALAAEFAPRVAGGLAVLMLATAAVGMGSDAWEGISTITRSQN